MSRNSISEFDDIYIITPKMGLIDTKTVDSTANVINKIESSNADLQLTNILLSVIVFVLCAYVIYKAYIMHNKCIKKRALSQANDLDKI